MSKKKTKENKEEKKQKDEREKADTNKYVHLQMLDQQIRQVQQYLQNFDQQLVEIRKVIKSLKDLSKLKKGDSILAPLASGIFVKAKLEDSQEVRVNVGSNTVVTKNIEGAVKMLEEQEVEINQYRSDTLVKYEELMKQAEELQQ